MKENEKGNINSYTLFLDKSDYDMLVEEDIGDNNVMVVQDLIDDFVISDSGDKGDIDAIVLKQRTKNECILIMKNGKVDVDKLNTDDFSFTKIEKIKGIKI